MNDLVGIIRTAEEMRRALDTLRTLRERVHRVVVTGNRQFNPAWHLALDLRNLVDVSLCVTSAALERTESRGGHTRDDFPAMDLDWRHQLLVCAREGADTVLTRQQQTPVRPDLLALFEPDELAKYFTKDERRHHE